MEILDNQKRFLSILGLIFVFLALVSYLLLFYELAIFDLRPWPYDSGASWQRVVLYDSLFLVQWIAHCQYLDLSALGYLVWKYWGCLFGVGLGFLLKFHAESKERHPLLDRLEPRLSLFGVIGVFLASCVLYLLYALDFQKGKYYPLLNFSLIFVYPFFYPIFVLVFLPPLVFYVAHRAVSSKSFLIAFPFLAILDIFLTVVIYVFSHSCI
ncbi:MAG: hypothetical protein ACFFFH_21520 [Candidatus Thorarchaeota archaeon]